MSSSTACSGWGISPNTLPASLHTPAMSRSEPLKFSPGRVAQHDLAAILHRVERALLGVVAAPGVLDGDAERGARRARARERGVGARHLAASTWRKVKRRLALTSSAPGSRPRLAQHLKAVADAEHQAAVAGERDHRLHRRREARDRAGAQVVAVGEAAWDDDRVGAAQVALGVPDQLGLAHAPRRVARVESSQEPGNWRTPNFTRAQTSPSSSCTS